MKPINVYNQNGEKKSNIKLDDNVFGVEKNDKLISKAVITELANHRTAHAKTKTCAQVRGGGAKPWRQKGTGRARAGSIRSPLWRGGGVTFGPTGKENYSLKIPSKMRKQALIAALSNKMKTKNIIVLDKIEFKNIKTKQVDEMLNKLPVKEGTFLFIYDKIDPKVELSMRNLPYLKTIQQNSLTVYDLLKYEWIITTLDVIKSIERKLKK